MHHSNPIITAQSWPSELRRPTVESAEDEHHAEHIVYDAAQYLLFPPTHAICTRILMCQPIELSDPTSPHAPSHTDDHIETVGDAVRLLYERFRRKKTEFQRAKRLVQTSLRAAHAHAPRSHDHAAPSWQHTDRQVSLIIMRALHVDVDELVLSDADLRFMGTEMWRELLECIGGIACEVGKCSAKVDTLALLSLR